MLGKGNRLRPLQMRIAGHDGLGMRLRLFAQDLLHLQKLFDHAGNFLAQIQPEIERDLIVPASCRMQALAGVADFRGQQRLDVHVDILVVGGKRNLARLDLRQKLRQPLLDFLVVLRRENAAVAEHLRVRHGAGDVLLVKSLVKGNRGVEVVDQLVGLFLKASCPKFHSLFLARQPARPGRLSGISFVFTLYCSSGAADPHLLCARDVPPEEGAEGEGVSCILRASRNALPTEQIRADQSLPDFSRDCTFVGRPQMLMKPADCAWSKSLSPKVTRFSEYRELGEVIPALIMLPL